VLEVSYYSPLDAFEQLPARHLGCEPNQDALYRAAFRRSD
jgi:hypothetical protein